MDGTTVVPVNTPSAVTSFIPVAASQVTDTVASTNLFPLVLNGDSINVKSYIPAAAAGYTTFIRVVNRGSLAGAVSAAVIDQTTGVAGASAVIIPALPVGGAATLSSTQVEAAVGAVADGSTRPTLQITAPTNGLKVQSFILTNANGNFAEVSGNE